jgi:prolyl-tRNA synthetase
MRASNYFFPTLREVSTDVEMPGHRFLLRGGFVRQLSSGVYTYLPLGWRVVRKVEQIMREEMERIGACELLMPAMSPQELWIESGRDESMADVLFKLKDRSGRTQVLGPTHEEVVTDIIRHTVSSYRDLPILLFQIQTKFRDEPRPRGGMIRGREFVMKDLYSFHADEASLDSVYKNTAESYRNFIRRCDLDFVEVEAEGGAIGGSETREFHVINGAGEDTILVCDSCDYAATLESARAGEIVPPPKPDELPLSEVDTPGRKTVEEVTEFLGVRPTDLVKTLIYTAGDKIIGAMVRGDRELNETKLAKALGLAAVEMADAETVEKVTGAPVGFAGPVALKGIKLIADTEVKGMANFVTGANRADAHHTNVNVPRDFSPESYVDLRNAAAGDPCPVCQGNLAQKNGIEIGHIFKLGTKYSESMKAYLTDSEHQDHPIIMGCYGCGITRTVSAVAETHHDSDGLIWPVSIAPFHVHLVPVMDIKSDTQRELADEVHRQLIEAGIEVFYDDRDERAGVKFKDADLIGIPLQVVVGRLAKEGKVQFRSRRREGEGAFSEEVEASGLLAAIRCALDPEA